MADQPRAKVITGPVPADPGEATVDPATGSTQPAVAYERTSPSSPGRPSSPERLESGSRGDPPSPPDLAGQMLGDKYQLGRVIGEGGMGAVYEAMQLDLRRPVAIKMLATRYAGREDLLARFEREARLAAAIGHQNIIQIHEVGRTPSGAPYIVMERLEGPSLKSLLEQDEGMAVGRLVNLIDQLLSALQAAHAKGVVHRDIKPENMIVFTDDDGDHLKVLDFGVSKITEGEDAQLRLTRTGTLMGTPLYMSPEQARGELEIDHRADLYAVGVILYRALSGRFPHQASNFNALVASLITSNAPPLDTVAPDLHPAWVELVGRAMGRAPEERFQSAKEMRAALRALPPEALGGHSKGAANPSVPRLQALSPLLEPTPATVGPPPRATSRSALDSATVAPEAAVSPRRVAPLLLLVFLATVLAGAAVWYFLGR